LKAAVTRKTKHAQTDFVTTRWSLIRNGHISGARTVANAELAQLCQIYWHPVFTFIYRRGYSTHDAQDLTQDFFLRILQGNLFQTADPRRGRFRQLLRRSIENFLIDAKEKRCSHKRGGALQFVAWEQWMADAPLQLALPAAVLKSSPAEALFDLGWAAAIVEEALRTLRMACESKGRRRVFEVLQGYLDSERDDVCYEDLSRALGIPESSVRNLLHQFRKRYRALLRKEVAKTVGGDTSVDDEIRHLCAALSLATRCNA
jgi:DNA-directed RNA polymerase specialized sigma24 family protein